MRGLKDITPYNDFIHLLKDEPWIEESIRPQSVENLTDSDSISQLWYTVLRQANKRYGLGIENSFRLQPTQPHMFKFAYSYLIAGCDPENPNYLGFMYSVMISKYLLQHYESKADVVLMIRMHKESSHIKLPDDQELMLEKMGIIVKYIPKPKVENFHTAMMDKFRILEYEEYDRVLYLDADVIPLNNLDYMFEKSVGHNAVLEENVIIAYTRDPANGGFFMLKPNKTDYVEISKIIEETGKEGYVFNEILGFGHEIVPPDYWQSIFEKKRTWNFYGAFTDQGLLYHWVKYVKKKCSQIIAKKMLTFRADADGNVRLVARTSNDSIFGDVKKYGHLNATHIKDLSKVVPYRDMFHFFLKLKPWLGHSVRPPDVDEITQAETPVQLWFCVLEKINDMHQFGIDTKNLVMGNSPLGHEPQKNMLKQE